MNFRWEFPESAPAQFVARSPSYPWMVVGTVCIGAFIGQVGASIIQLAKPSLEDAFDAPLHTVSWAAVGYVLAFASALPVFAHLAEIGGRKTLYLARFVLFGLFSALSGFATSLATLIIFRLQGASGPMLGADSLVILVAAAGPTRRGKAIGVMAAAQAVGLGLGPAFGGVLLSAFGWRSILWLTVPFAMSVGPAPHRANYSTEPTRRLYLAKKKSARAVDRPQSLPHLQYFGWGRRRPHFLCHAL